MSVTGKSEVSSDEILQKELQAEQAYVDLVYTELDKARARADLVASEGLERGKTDRTGTIRDEEITGLFERDALVFNAGRRRASLERQDEGLVFGRLDMDHSMSADDPDAAEEIETAGMPRPRLRPGDDPREVRYIGRLGVRDENYDSLVIDWRAPAAAPFYRATPVQPLDVVRRRVLRSSGRTVIGAEDDLMVTEAPDGMVVLGDGALLAALGRSRDGGMRDIVATIQAHQDEAIRAPARGVTTITGGPGTGKTVVALHRAAFLLYSDRRRYEGGGVLVVGPSAAYTAYIERVLPSLGEDSVSLRSLGDVQETVSTGRLDPPLVAHVKGSMRMRTLLKRAAKDFIPNAPADLRTFVSGHPVRLTGRDLGKARTAVLRRHRRNASVAQMRKALGQAALEQVHGTDPLPEDEREEFLEKFADSLDVDTFMEQWWRPVDPREVLLWCRDHERAQRYGKGLYTPEELDAFADSMQRAVDTATWSVADVALVDALSVIVGIVPEEQEERGFYEVDLLDDAEAEAIAAGQLKDHGLTGVFSPYRERTARDATTLSEADRLDILLQGRIEAPDEFAHVLIDEAQDISPMQWRMIGRRGTWASWTVVGDAAQASWPDEDEAAAAREEAFGTGPRRHFRMTTNYRNAKEIFDVAADLIRREVPDADIPDAVRAVGVEPVQRALTVGDVPGERPSTAQSEHVTDAVTQSLSTLTDEVDGILAVITPERWAEPLADALADGTLVPDTAAPRVQVLDALTTKGLEYDATVVLDPEQIAAESAGGQRTLYVALTRAAHRMHVLHVA